MINKVTEEHNRIVLAIEGRHAIEIFGTIDLRKLFEALGGEFNYETEKFKIYNMEIHHDNLWDKVFKSKCMQLSVHEVDWIET